MVLGWVMPLSGMVLVPGLGVLPMSPPGVVVPGVVPGAIPPLPMPPLPAAPPPAPPAAYAAAAVPAMNKAASISFDRFFMIASLWGESSGEPSALSFTHWYPLGLRCPLRDPAQESARVKALRLRRLAYRRESESEIIGIGQVVAF